MQSVPVVVVLASQLKCPYCAHESERTLENFRAIHVCSHCGQAQPLSETQDYFELFGVPRKFRQDLSLLEKRFYELSRALHPDRFASQGVEQKAVSLQRMSLLNQAYTTLKNAQALRDYLLKLEGLLSPSQGNTQKAAAVSLPFELAEAWFEIQDLLAELSGESEEEKVRIQEKLALYENEMAQAREQGELELSELESEFDQNSDPEVLRKMVQKIQTQSYLKSLERDVERIKLRIDPAQTPRK